MITDLQQEQAALFALGALSAEEQQRFVAQVQADPELRVFLASLQNTVDQMALAIPQATPPTALKNKLLLRLQTGTNPVARQPLAELSPARATPGLSFRLGAESSGWKQLPIAGAWIKLLSAQPDRGYAVLMGKLDPGVRYPAHINIGPEDFYILTGDLHVSDKTLGPGDFHHADAGSAHQENFSVAGCTLLAVLTMDDPLVGLAMA